MGRARGTRADRTLPAPTSECGDGENRGLGSKPPDGAAAPPARRLRLDGDGAGALVSASNRYFPMYRKSEASVPLRTRAHSGHRNVGLSPDTVAKLCPSRICATLIRRCARLSKNESRTPRFYSDWCVSSLCLEFCNRIRRKAVVRNGGGKLQLLAEAVEKVGADRFCATIVPVG